MYRKRAVFSALLCLLIRGSQAKFLLVEYGPPVGMDQTIRLTSSTLMMEAIPITSVPSVWVL